MKTGLIACLALGVVAANAQAPQTEDSLEARTARRVQETQLELRVQKPNEDWLVGKLHVSGIAAQLARADNLLQLINPLAPPEYGAAEDDVVWDPVTGRASGLKLFSISLGK